MPKVIVVSCGEPFVTSSLAQAAAEGARSVRFSEVDVVTYLRHDQEIVSRDVVDSAEQMREYDGVVIAAASSAGEERRLDELLSMLEAYEPLDAFANTVFAFAGEARPTDVDRVVRLGGIVVCAGKGVDDPAARARGAGRRVAKVVGWVRHALSHEHSDHHHHQDHAHPHEH
jgi:hypothetical protein